MMPRPARLAIAALLALAGSAHAQDPSPGPTAFVYQGHLEQAGAPATGSYDFRVALFDSVSGGTPVFTGSGNPALIVREDVPVASGVFLLGLDFLDGIYGGPRWLEIAVRPGASTGAFTILPPRQPITPMPQAIHALSARTVAGLACTDGQILKWQGSGWSCGTDVSAGTVSSITAGAGLVGGTASGSIAIAPEGITSAMLAPGAVTRRALRDQSVGAAQADPQFQRRLWRRCADGVLQGFDGDGGAICAPVGAAPVVTRYAGVRVAAAAMRPDGRPVLAVQQAGAIRVLSCEDPECTRLSSDVVIGSGTPDALVVPADDRPAILSGTTVYKCADSACTSARANLIEDVSRPSSGVRPVMVIGADGLPVIVWAYQAIQIAKCLDQACSTAVVSSHDPFTDTVMGLSAVIDAQGVPVVAYGLAGASGVRVLRCTAPECSSSATARLPGRGNEVAVAVQAPGLPIIAYRDPATNRIEVVQCLDATCSAVGAPSDLGSSRFGPNLQLGIAAGRPWFQFEDWNAVGPTSARLGVCRSGCGRSEPVMAFEASPFASSRALLFDPDGRPFLMYVSERQDPATGVITESALVTVKCRSTNCQ